MMRPKINDPVISGPRVFTDIIFFIAVAYWDSKSTAMCSPFHQIIRSVQRELYTYPRALLCSRLKQNISCRYFRTHPPLQYYESIYVLDDLAEST
jgi:hypothetical protein